jgi:hypothetical protein
LHRFCAKEFRKGPFARPSAIPRFGSISELDPHRPIPWACQKTVNQLRISLYEKLPLVYSHSADRTSAPAHLGSHCGLHVFLRLRRPPGARRKSTGPAGRSTGAAGGSTGAGRLDELLIPPAWEQDEAVPAAASSARPLKPGCEGDDQKRFFCASLSRDERISSHRPVILQVH